MTTPRPDGGAHEGDQSWTPAVPQQPGPPPVDDAAGPPSGAPGPAAPVPAAGDVLVPGVPSPALPADGDPAATPPTGWYPQEAYYAEGWQAPAEQVVRRRPARSLVRVVVAVLVLASVGTVTAVLLRRAAVLPVGDVTSPVTANARQVRPGHCVAELPEDGAVARVRLVPCDEPHEAEALALHDLGDGAWPGALDVRRRATDACEMDAAQAEAGARAVVWTPSEQGWADGDRTALCLAWHPDGAVTGSWRTGDVAPAG